MARISRHVQAEEISNDIASICEIHGEIVDVERCTFAIDGHAAPTYPVPSNESFRLAELASLSLLHGAPMAEFQILCEVVARIMGTPVSCVSLVESSFQRFIGMTGTMRFNGLPRKLSFCAHTIMKSEPLVVRNAAKDSRFSRNPMVTGNPGIRAYAGVPLETSPGCIVGTLCAVDLRERRFSKSQVEELRKLGAVAVRLLTSHRANVALKHGAAVQAENERRLRFAADHDPLTGLCNVTNFRDLASSVISEATGQASAALMIIDIDHFKTINDRFGHAYGDRYLQAMAEALKKSVRPGDLVGRIGGDEFAIMLSNLAHPEEEAEAIVAGLRENLRKAAECLGQPELSKSSIGLAFAPRHAADFGNLYAHADVALYAAKAAGRNTHIIFDPRRCHGTNLRTLRAEMIDAFERGEFVPFYQGKFDLKDMSIRGFEVLARWQHPVKGLLPPAHFTAGLNDRVVGPLLTRSMLTSALQDYAKWKLQGYRPGQLAINVCTFDLLDPNFAIDFLAILAKSNCRAHDVTLEITETVIMGEAEGQIYKTLSHLRSQGVSVALDDFGTGFASLQHLRAWPIDSIKIDKTFVDNCLSSAQDQAILRAVLTLAQELGLTVVAEGIETTQQAAMLTSLKCDVGQGYLFCPPIAATHVTDLLSKQIGAHKALVLSFRGKSVPVRL